MDVYNIGGGQRVPKDSEYLGCMRDEKYSYDARALFEGLLKCPDNMTTQVRQTDRQRGRQRGGKESPSRL